MLRNDGTHLGEREQPWSAFARAHDGNIITSRGPATALPFALRVAEHLVGRRVADGVAQRMLAPLVLK
jgi:transcriptional regulator GlxA family with amidase domain